MKHQKVAAKAAEMPADDPSTTLMQVASRGPAFAPEVSLDSTRSSTSREQHKEERIDFSDTLTRAKPTMAGTVGADADSFRQTKTTTDASEESDDDWRTMLTLRQKRQQTRRIAPKFGRLANVTTVASVDVSPPTDLAATIRAIVREELQRQGGRVDETIPHPPTNPPYYTAAPSATLPPSVCVADISEIANPRPRRDSFTANQRYGQRLRHGPATHRWAAPAQQARHRPFTAERSQHWFSERPLPVCYNCGFEGHIARYCNYRQPPRYDRSPRFNRSGLTRAPTFPGSASYEIPGPLRNQSPASDRSVTPPPAPRANRSPSPRHRHSSPLTEN
ncbi:hypothetical protein HPB51_012603 [Rhipicephalus microplus]|uniref:CCHC-type domain-containing protein n=1 Tax=Rhipicephalus microplus TaxID=6941 RepID=A0A9J6E1I8_RHIMP|nr:hypothetical protein HPB51_012603 [Rhipicephalus microplus]